MKLCWSSCWRSQQQQSGLTSARRSGGRDNRKVGMLFGNEPCRRCASLDKSAYVELIKRSCLAEEGASISERLSEVRWVWCFAGVICMRYYFVVLRERLVAGRPQGLYTERRGDDCREKKVTSGIRTIDSKSRIPTPRPLD